MEDERKTKKQLIEELNALRLEQIEQTRVTSEKFTKAFLQNSIPTIISTVKEGRIFEASDAFLRIVGLNRDEVVGRTSIEIGYFTQEQRASFINELNKRGCIEDFEMEIKARNGDLRYGLFNTVMMSINNENYLLTTIQDITARKLAESQLEAAIEALQVIRERERGILLSVPHALFGVEQRHIFFANDAMEDVFGWKPEELIGKSTRIIFRTDEEWHEYGAILYSRLATEPVVVFEWDIPFVRKDGSEFFCRMSVSRTGAELGENRRIVATFEDITYRKRAEENLKKSKDMLSLISDNMSDMIRVTDLQGANLYTSPSHFKGLGYRPEERIGKSVFEVVHPDDLERIIKFFSEGLTDNRRATAEYRVRHADGHYVWLETVGDLLRDAQGKATAIVMSSRDISQRKATTEELIRNEQKYRTLIETTRTGFVILDQNGLVLDANPEYVRLTGHHNLSEIVGKSVIEWTADHDKEKNTAAVGECFGKGYIRNLEIGYVDAKGNITPIEINATLMQSGGVTQILTLCRDITERKKAEEELLIKDRAIASSFNAIAISDLDGKLTYVNDALLNIWGYSAQEALNINAADLASSKDEINQIINDIQEKGFSFGESIGIRKNGSLFNLQFFASLITSSENKPIAMLSTFLDITERKQADRFFKEVITKNPMSIQILDKEGFTLEVNPSFELLFGAMPPSDYSIFNDIQLAKQGMGAIFDQLRNGEVVHIPDTYFNVRDSISGLPDVPVWVKTIGFPLNDSNQKPVRFILMHENITARKKSEEALKTSEVNYREIFNAVNDAIWVHDIETAKFLDVNNTVTEIFGHSVSEALNMNVADISSGVPPFVQETAMELFRKAAGGQPQFFEWQCKHKDGHLFWTEVNLKRATIAGKECVLAIERDITERKQAEVMRREQENKLSSIFRAAPVGIGMVINRVFQECNDTLCLMTGYSREELLGKNARILYTTDEDYEYVGKTKYRQIAENGIGTVETHWKRKDGKVIDIILSSTPLEPDDLAKGVTFTALDITERKQAEEEKRILKERLQHAEKIEAIGTLAGGVAHDFNNLLMGIQGNASLALKDIDPTHPTYENLKRIEEQVQSGATLTKQLLGFARGGKYEVKPTDMNEILEKISSMFGRTKKEISIQRKHGKDLWSVEVDRGQMEQVFLNLYVNAWQAMPGGGEIYLETQNVLLDEAIALSLFAKPGKYVKIAVTDTGTGMDEKTKARIFEPFFTTKGMGRGSGLGLATVYGIIKGHHGMINVYSEPGHGTTFTVYLPASEKEVVTEKTATEEIVRGKETILLVDDQKMVMEVSKEMLETLGYKVYAAGSGQEAIAVYMEKKDKIDLVILDMIMPGISGAGTFDRLREINPDVKILLSSGYSLNGQAQEILDRGCKGFLQKPFRLSQLSGKIREILD